MPLKSDPVVRGRRLAVVAMAQLLLGALALSPAPAQVAPAAQAMQATQATQSRQLRIAGARFEQIYERGDNGEFSGMGVELVRLLASRHGYTVRFDIYPWKRAQVLVEQGMADLLVGPYRSPERLRKMAFSAQPFFRDQLVFYVRTGTQGSWHGDYAALSGKRVVALNGWIYGDAFDAARASLQLSIANTVPNGLNMLAHRHVDLFASNRRDTDPVVRAMGLADQVMALEPAIDLKDAFFAFPRGPRWDVVRAQFDQLLDELRASGELQRIGRRYGVQTP